MSRYELAGRKPGTTVSVGWDHPLLTYFIQVYDEAVDEEENPIVWRGGMARELDDLNDLLRALRPHADLPVALVANLYGDRDEGR